MGLDGYKIRDHEAMHFITFATLQWLDVFTRSDYVHIILDSISIAKKKKDYYFMLIVSCLIIYI